MYKKLDFNTENLESLSSSELQKLADYWLRQYILSQNQERTYYFCPLKGRSYSADKMHVAHFIDRQCLNTRYDLNNCHLISEQSNKWESQILVDGYKSKHHYEYEMWLKEEIGEKKFEELIAKSKIITIFAKEDYIKLINKFRNE